MSDIRLDVPNIKVTISHPDTATRVSGSTMRVAESALTSSYALTASYIGGVARAELFEGQFSGSFTGSYKGDGSQLTGVVASGVAVNVSDDNIDQGTAQVISFNSMLSASVVGNTASVSVVLPNGVVSSSAQAITWTVATASYVSGAASTWDTIANKPAGLVSSSAQVTTWTVATASLALNANLLDARDSTTFASTGSNTFIGTQIITGSINLSGSIGRASYIDIDTTAVNDGAVGRLTWNDGDGTLDLGLKGGNTTIQIGQELVARVFNAEANTLTNGEVVYIFGAQGNRVAVLRASATAEMGSANTLGVVTEPILTGQEGFITLFGVVRGLNTVGLTEGSLLWLSASAGQYTETRPQAPNHGVLIGYVERVHASVGSIFVKVDNGFELDELHDVNVSGTSSYGDLLVRSGSVWIDGRQLTGSYGLTGSLSISGGTLQGTSSRAISSSYATTASTAVNSLITASVADTTITFTKGDGSQFSVTVAQSGSVSSASFATFATSAGSSTSASYALTASYALNGGGGVSSSYALTSSFAQTALTASFFTGSIEFTDGLIVTGSVRATTGFTGSLSGSATNAVSSSYALTASYALTGGGSGVSSSYATTASYATVAQNVLGSITSASYALSASFAQSAITASFFTGSVDFPNGLIVTGSVVATGGFTGSLSGSISSAISSSYALTASYALNGGGGGVSSSYALTASFVQQAQTALTASYISGGVSFPSGLDITGSLNVSGSITGSLFGTASLALQNIVTASAAASTITFTKGDGSQFSVTVAQSGSISSASYATFAVTATSASYASTASYVVNSISSSYALTASYFDSFVTFPSGLSVTGSLIVSSSGIQAIGAGFTGSLSGSATSAISSSFSTTSSYALVAQNVLGSITSASYALTASYALNGGGSGSSVSSSYATTASYVQNAVTASYFSGSITGSLMGTSSWASNVISSSFATTASYASVAQNVLGSITSASYAGTASVLLGSVQSASFATTASYAQTTLTASFVSGNINFPNGLEVTGSLIVTGGITGSLSGSATTSISSSYALTASYALNGGGGVSSSYAITASFAQTALTASFFTGSVEFTDGLVVTGSIYATTGFTGSLSGSATNAVSSSYALTASYALNGGGGGVSSSYALTSSYATVAQTLLGSVTSASFAVTASYAQTALTASYISGGVSFPNGLDITGSLNISGSITGSLMGTASWALNVVSSSYAATASLLLGSVVSASYAASSSVATELVKQSITMSSSISPAFTTITSGSQHLSDGVYVISSVLNSVSLTNYRIAGTFAWYTGSVSQTDADEISLHRTGQSASSASIFMRTSAVSGSTTFLQIGSDLTLATGSYTFTLVKMI